MIAVSITDRSQTLSTCSHRCSISIWPQQRQVTP